MLNLKKIKIDATDTVGQRLLLTDVRPVYAYDASGKKSNDVTGYRYIVVTLEREYEKISVKIDGKQLMEKPTEGIDVQFDNLQLSLYYANGTTNISAQASGIRCTKKQTQTM